MFGRGRFANRPYNVLISQGFPFQLRHSYPNQLRMLSLDDDKTQQTRRPRVPTKRFGVQHTTTFYPITVGEREF